jgi:hypothetical protein
LHPEETPLRGLKKWGALVAKLDEQKCFQNLETKYA